MTWDEFIAVGEKVDDAEVDARVDKLSFDDLGTLIYTSGTTGPPQSGDAVAREPGLDSSDRDRGLQTWGRRHQRLILASVPHRRADVHDSHPGYGRWQCVLRRIDRALADNIKQARPTVFAGVPRVWEKFHAGVVSELDKATGVKAKIAHWAMSVGRQANAVRNRGAEPRGALMLQERVADKLVLSKVRHALGLDKGRVLVTAAAPISAEILEFFSAFFVIHEVYGQSEANGPTSLTLPGRTKFGSVGVPFPGTEVKIAEDGEIVVRGPHVFMGYLNDSAATAETLVDGWLQSGDLGEFDESGYLTITGRKKDIIITAGGKNIAPSLLESGIKDSPVVSEAVVIGDRRKYLTALVTLEEDGVAEFMKKCSLSGAAHELPEVAAEVQTAVDNVNRRVARVEQIKTFTILPRQLSIEGGELTPTLKVKRDKVAAHFASEIEAMYAE